MVPEPIDNEDKIEAPGVQQASISHQMHMKPMVPRKPLPHILPMPTPMQLP